MLCGEDVCEVGLSFGCDEELWPDLALARAARSSLRVVASPMMMSGLAIMSSMVAGVAYMPCLRIEGDTSLVTQRLNALASGLRLLGMSEYKPDSLTVVSSCFPQGCP